MDLWISAVGGKLLYSPARVARVIYKSRDQWIYGLLAGGQGVFNILPLVALAKSRNPANQKDLWISAAGGEALYILLLAALTKSINLEINGFMDYWPEARELFFCIF